MEAHLLNSILQLRSCESEVLKSTHNGPVERGIRHRGSICSGKLGLRVDWSRRGFAIKHTSVLKNLMCVLPLMKEEVIGATLHFNPEEVVERTQILEGKLGTEASREVLKESRGGCRQDDVVDV